MTVTSRQRPWQRASIRFATSIATASALLTSAWAGGPENAPVARPPATEATTDRYIVKFRDPDADPRSRLPALSATLGANVSFVRSMSGGAHVIRIDRNLSLSSARALSYQAMRDSNIQYIEPDRKLYPLLVPNDPQYNGQWNLFEAAGGINAPAAWDVTTGSASIVIGIVDTGYRPHVDFASRVLPGYDFISDQSVSNDGNGRDADASDPGDYNCNGTGNNSSWHGTHVTGIAAASSNNGVGIAGVNWLSKILPIRVLGRCGGFTSDIVDGMRWAAGIPVSGLPANPNPARVLNLSLGGDGGCDNASQSAVNDVIAVGTVVVVAAGNSNADVSTSSPANCSNVIAVGATTRSGARASYSNYGAGVTLSAPGSGILSTLNTGTTTPGSDTYVTYNGTSMATPHVAGVVSLMLSQNPALTPAQVKAKLQSSARAFPTGTGADCTTALCGAGIVDARAALATTTPARVNYALQANGGTATASSAYSGYPAASVNNGDRRGVGWSNGGGWNDATAGSYPDWVRVDFSAPRTISEIDVFTLQDNYGNPVEPTEAMTFTQYGIVAFDVQYWNGSAWVTIPNGSVSGNNKVWNKFTFAAVTTTAIRVQVNRSLYDYSRVVELEAYGDGAPPAPPPPVPVNVALPANGGSVVASSTYSTRYSEVGAINGDRRGSNWENNGGWNDATADGYPDWLQVNFSGTKSINEIDVFTVQDNYSNPAEPTATMTFSQYGIKDFDVQYRNGSTWVTVPNGAVNGNNLVWRKFTFAAISTNAIRVYVRNAGASYSRITEVEAYLAQ